MFYNICDRSQCVNNDTEDICNIIMHEMIEHEGGKRKVINEEIKRKELIRMKLRK